MADCGDMVHVPLLRLGRTYESIDQVELVHHATGEPVARVSQANAGLVARDVGRMNGGVLRSITMADMLRLCRTAAGVFVDGTVPLGGGGQGFDDYIRQLSATTGMPQVLCRANARKIHRVLDEMDRVLAGLTRGFDLSILDRGYGQDNGRTLSWFGLARVFGAVLPSNSPGVHSLWIPAIALKTPTVVKPGREEPWTPWRILQCFIAAGLPGEALGFYPCEHGGAGQLLLAVDRAMLFGDSSTTRPWRNDQRVQLHGPGFSKVILGPDAARDWEGHVDLIVSSILANGGRSCINASAVWTPSNADAIAQAVAQRLAKVEALGADDPKAELAAFANPQVAQRTSDSIDAAMSGARDVTQEIRGSHRLVRRGRCAYLLPTLIRCQRDHPLANREFLFPYASVVECPAGEIAASVGPTLVASVISQDEDFRRAMMACGDVDRLNLGPIPTWQLSWDQPHEGNLFEHLYRQRAFQAA